MAINLSHQLSRSLPPFLSLSPLPPPPTPPPPPQALGYDDENATEYWELNRRGALTSLLLQSPWGELPDGGRSSQHQWNEAVSCAIFELWASKMKAEGNATYAGFFKRAAAISLSSLGRWKRPTGEWTVVKNRFDPSTRHGYEGYSYYSQVGRTAQQRGGAAARRPAR